MSHTSNISTDIIGRPVFPPELFLMIIKCAADDKRTLKALSLVNRVFCYESFIFLHKDIYLAGGVNRVTEGLNLISTGYAVRHVNNLIIGKSAIVLEDNLKRILQAADPLYPWPIFPNTDRNLENTSRTLSHSLQAFLTAARQHRLSSITIDHSDKGEAWGNKMAYSVRTYVDIGASAQLVAIATALSKVDLPSLRKLTTNFLPSHQFGILAGGPRIVDGTPESGVTVSWPKPHGPRTGPWLESDIYKANLKRLESLNLRYNGDRNGHHQFYSLQDTEFIARFFTTYATNVKEFTLDIGTTQPVYNSNKQFLFLLRSEKLTSITINGLAGSGLDKLALQCPNLQNISLSNLSNLYKPWSFIFHQFIHLARLRSLHVDGLQYPVRAWKPQVNCGLEQRALITPNEIDSDSLKWLVQKLLRIGGTVTQCQGVERVTDPERLRICYHTGNGNLDCPVLAQ